MKKLLHNIGSYGWALIHSIPKVVRQPSLWPDEPRKSLLRRYIELLYLRSKYGSLNLSYNALGMDVKSGVTVFDFVSKDAPRWQPAISYVFTDKYLFYLYFKAKNLPVIPVAAITHGKKIWIENVGLSDVQTLMDAADEKMIIKPVDGICGQGVTVLNNEDLGDVVTYNYDVIIQRMMVNHPDISRLNPCSLNTLRLVTYIDVNGEPQFMADGVLRIGGPGAVVDNYFMGGCECRMRWEWNAV